MLRKRVAAMFIPLLIGISGAVLAGASVSSPADAAEGEAKLSGSFSVLRAVSQWSTKVSEMADKRAKSDLVKGYARSVATANADVDAKLQLLAQKQGIAIVALDPQTEEGKS